LLIFSFILEFGCYKATPYDEYAIKSTRLWYGPRVTHEVWE